MDPHGFRETNLLAAASGACWRLALGPVNVPGFPSFFNLGVVRQDASLQLSATYLKVLKPLQPQDGE